MTQTNHDPWAEHVAAMDKCKILIGEMEKAEQRAVQIIDTATAKGEMNHEDLSADLEQLDELRGMLTAQRANLRSLELAYAQHASYEAAAVDATISADQPAGQPSDDEDDEGEADEDDEDDEDDEE